MANEAVIANCDKFTNKGMGLDLCSLADCYILLDFDKRADKRIITNSTAIDIGWFNDFHIAPEKHITNRNLESNGLIIHVIIAIG